MENHLKNQVDIFPTDSGVYLMKDSQSKIIYVGKAKNLRHRVKQYIHFSDKRHQVRFLMSKVHTIDYIVTATEKEALLLENSLIKKHKPRYNVFLKDDKTYLGLKITQQDDFPRLLETRKLAHDGSLYFGPFIHADAVREVKDFIYRFFMLRTCSDHDFKSRTRPCLEYQIKRCSAPCVGYVNQAEYQKQVDEVRLFLEGQNQTLAQNLEKKMLDLAQDEKFEEAIRLRDLLKNMTTVLTTQHMTHLAFEFVDFIATKQTEDKISILVLMVRDHKVMDSQFFSFDLWEEPELTLQSFMIQYYSETAFIPHEIVTTLKSLDTQALKQILKDRAQRTVHIRTHVKADKKHLLLMAQKNLESHLQEAQDQSQKRLHTLQKIQSLLHLKNRPDRMECYDISNISGQYAVGSMVCFVEGQKAPSQYKKFKIKTQETPNDYAMMSEVLIRRLKNSSWPKPQLIVLDGGKGQLHVVQKIFSDLHIDDIDLLAISKGQGQGARARGVYADKKQDEIYVPHRKNPHHLDPRSAELMLIQSIRDEAHRFAIDYHRKLREKSVTASWLDDVSGLGPRTKIRLLKHFGSPQALAEASWSELEAIPRLSSRVIAELKNHIILLTKSKKV